VGEFPAGPLRDLFCGEVLLQTVARAGVVEPVRPALASSTSSLMLLVGTEGAATNRVQCRGYFTSVTGMVVRWMTLVATEPMTRLEIAVIPRVPMTIPSQ